MQPVMILARLAWLRLWRGRTKWVTALLAILPPCFAALLMTEKDDAVEVWQITLFFALRAAVLLAVAVHLASSVGDELDSKTYTYLWSRPMRRSAVLLGKLLAIAPTVFAAFALSLTATWLVVFQDQAGANLEWLLRGLAAELAVVIAGASIALATSALVPKRPLAFVLGYMMFLERLEFVPFLQQISIAYHASAISAAHPPSFVVGTATSGVIGILVLSTFWLGLAIWRVENAEYALPDG